MKTLKHWMSQVENRWKLRQDQVTIILNEIDDNVVSIKGSNIYPLTFSIIANVSSEILQ